MQSLIPIPKLNYFFLQNFPNNLKSRPKNVTKPNISITAMESSKRIYVRGTNIYFLPDNPFFP